MCVLPHALIGGSELTRAARSIPEVGVSFGGASELTRVAVHLVGTTGVVLDDSGVTWVVMCSVTATVVGVEFSDLELTSVVTCLVKATVGIGGSE